MSSFKLESAFAGFDQDLALINLPEQSRAKNETAIKLRHYIVNKLHPWQREEFSERIGMFSSNFKLYKHYSDATNGDSTVLPTFFYVFNNELFKISGARDIDVLDFTLFCNYRQVLVILTDDEVIFLSFSLEESSSPNSAASTTVNTKRHTEFKLLGTLSRQKMPKTSHGLSYANAHSSVGNLQFIFCKEYAYLISHLVDSNNAMALRVSPDSLQCEFFSCSTTPVIPKHEFVKNGLPKYIATPDGLFDLIDFTFYDLKNMYSRLDTNYKDLSYRIFTTSYGKKLLFVSNTEIYFSCLERPDLSQFDNGLTVDGVLYDLDEDCFVFPVAKKHASGNNWLKFFLYSDTIPHIFQINKTDYGIIFWDKKHHKFSKIIAKKFPTLVSHISTNSTDKASARKQIIFASVYGKRHRKDSPNAEHGFEEINANNLMIALSGDLEVLNVDNALRFETAVHFPKRRYEFKDDTVYNMGYKNSIDFLCNSVRVLHLYDQDALILKSYKGEFGEFIMMFLSGELKIDHSLSFFEYCKVDTLTDFRYIGYNYSTVKIAADNFVRFIQVVARKNDFENATFFIDITTHQILDYEQFASYVTSTFALNI